MSRCARCSNEMNQEENACSCCGSHPSIYPMCFICRLPIKGKLQIYILYTRFNILSRLVTKLSMLLTCDSHNMLEEFKDRNMYDQLYKNRTVISKLVLCVVKVRACLLMMVCYHLCESKVWPRCCCQHLNSSDINRRP